MKHILSLIIIILSTTNAQDRIWPTQTGKQLTSNFGEFRGDHFHMGIDIRTHASIGHPIYAVSDGYIQRITTNFNGYGKALYLKTNDGNIALYGHLLHYSNKLENYLFRLQNEEKSYFVKKYFSQEEYPVKRGDIIGYSGNSGGSMGPHLHFEFRNAFDQPMNPLKYDFPVNDNIAPIFTNLSIIPFASGTQIENSPLPQNYVPQQLASNYFNIADTVQVSGKFGFATHVIDKIQNASNIYQVEQIILLVDSVPVFSIKYDLLDFSESKYITTVLGQPTNNHNRSDFQKLYRLENYPKLSIHQDNNSGIIDLAVGLHKVEIIAMDAAQNKSSLAFIINSILATSNSTYYTVPQFHDFPKYRQYTSLFNTTLLQLEKGIIFQINTKLTDSEQSIVFIEKNNELTLFPLKKIDDATFVTDIIGHVNFENIESCGFLFHQDSIQKYDFEFIPKLLIPNSTTTIFSKDSLMQIDVENAVYDTAITWITDYQNSIAANHQNLQSAVYELHADGIPFKNSMEVSFSINNLDNIKNTALYTFNRKKAKWNFLDNHIDTTNSLSAKLNNSAIVAALIDTKPPWFISTYPKNQESYAKENFNNIIINVDDDLSGINSSEKYLQVQLDGKKLWVAYQPMQKRISYILRSSIAIGEHNLQINIQDRSGNSALKSINFFIE